MLAELLAGAEVGEPPAAPCDRAGEERRADRHEHDQRGPQSSRGRRGRRRDRGRGGEVEVLHRECRAASQQPRAGDSNGAEREYGGEINDDHLRPDHPPRISLLIANCVCLVLSCE